MMTGVSGEWGHLPLVVECMLFDRYLVVIKNDK